MASVVDGGRVVTELGRVKELVTQLEVHLGGSPERCKHLASQISCITDRCISLLVTAASIADAAATPGPLSDASDAPLKPAKKRKQTLDKKRHEVRVSSAGGGGEHPADDGHSWRKYGQKEILGAKHPRGYYRCTHRNSQGCAAIKQVQRTDEDPTSFDVVYLGEHTCAQSQTPAAGQGQAATAGARAPAHSPGATGLLQSLSSNLTVKTEGLAAAEPEPLQGWGATTTPFCFSSTPASGCLAPERSPFSAPSSSDNWGASPATSDSNHVVPFPPFEVAGGVQFGLQEVMSAFVPADDLLEDFDVSSFLV